MRTPKFWYNQKSSALSFLLAPLGRVYGLTHNIIHKFTKPWQSPIPVICVGNLVAGGHGKTPAALSICNILKSNRKAVHFISRGYKGSLSGPLLVDPKIHTANEVGDEPLLLSEIAPTWISANREASIILAHKMGAEIIIMDDGFQNPSVKKDLSIIVVDGEIGFGNGHLIPAGPLREDMATGLSRASAIIIIGEDKLDLKSMLSNFTTHPPQDPLKVITAQLKPVANPQSISKKKVLAFTGIGRPEKFFNTLAKMDCNIIRTKSFADHHQYTKKEIASLHKIARIDNAQLITTSKDYVRLTASQQKYIIAVPVILDWEDSSSLDGLLRPFI
jgi:tetraacyldisaccharide 4'-kinase